MVGIKQIVVVLAVSALLVAGLGWLGTYEPAEQELRTDESGQLETFDGPYSADVLEAVATDEASMTTTNETNPVAVFTTNQGVFEIELFADAMPITTGNFITLAEDGFYDDVKFHRIIEGFMIQGGDPNSKGDDTSNYGIGGPGYTIQDEFVADERLTNVRGTIAMANTGQPNSGGSQFFINTVDNVNLDFDKQPLTSRHPVFGKVISGMDVVDAIEKVATGERNVPVEPVVIESLTIRTP